ncbi:MAG: hypothetical protein KF726_01435 [Anaerolineae bacterium]|nr:hypothetical protein [Anaerolineae bacterium]
MNRNERLQREKLLLRYTSALERGDPEVLAVVLYEAESDPLLMQMIDELHAEYMEEPMVTVQVPSRSSRRYRLPLTLTAAMIAFLLIGGLLLEIYARRTIQIMFAASTATPTISATTTATATVTATLSSPRFYAETESRSRVFGPDGKLLSDIGWIYTSQFAWQDAPGVYRIEAFDNATGNSAPPQPDFVRSVMLTDPEPKTNQANKTLYARTVLVSKGAQAWYYDLYSNAPTWVEDMPEDYVFSWFGAKTGTTRSEDKLREFPGTDEIRQLPDETVLDRPVYVFETKTISTTNSIPSVRNIFKIDQQTSLLLASIHYDAQDQVIYEMQFTKLDLDPSFDAATFTMTVPDEGYHVPAAQPMAVETIWSDIEQQAEYDVYHISDQVMFENRLVLGKVFTDPLGRYCVITYYRRDALFAPPVLTLMLSNPNAGIMTKFPTATGELVDYKLISGGNDSRHVDDMVISVRAAEAKIDGNSGQYDFLWAYNPRLGSSDSMTDMSRTSIQLASPLGMFSEEQLISFVTSLQYVPPMVSYDEMTLAWLQLEKRAHFQLYRFSLFDFNTRIGEGSSAYALLPSLTTNASTGEGASAAMSVSSKLIPEKPVYINDVVVQRFRCTCQPGFALIITQGNLSAVAKSAEGFTSDGESVDVAGTTATYRQNVLTPFAVSRWLLMDVNGTTILLQAHVNVVSREELLAIAESLQEATAPTAGTVN